jgi:hypothetical protein
MGAHQAPELGQLNTSLVTAKELPTQLCFKFLDGACQGWLGHMTALGRAMEVEHVANRQEVLDLGHFHGAPLLMSPRHRGDY